MKFSGAVAYGSADTARCSISDPGHETYPIYHNTQVLKVLANGVRWARFSGNAETKGIGTCLQIKEPLETLSEKDYEEGAIEHPKEFIQ